MKQRKIKELQDEIIGLKQHIEQLQSGEQRAWDFVEDHFPAINNIEIKRGWYGGSHISTYKVTIDVYAEDLTKMIKFLTNKKLNEKKWEMISKQIKANKEDE